MASTEERLARIEGGYEHLATRADIGEIKGDIKLLKWAIGVQFALLIIILGRLFEIIPLG